MQLAALNDKKLVFLIRYVPTLVVALFAFVSMLVFINDSTEKAQQSIAALRTQMLDHQKQMIADQVGEVLDQIAFRQTQTVDELMSQAKSRVYEAHDIAQSIYLNNPTKPKAEIRKMISDALRPIRFYNQRGYFFIFQMDGTNVMHALKPQLEGKSAWGAKDIKGTFILQEHIKLIQANGGEAFYRWWYQKPGYPVTQEFEKIGFGKAFEPYQWFIGTGEYVADVENDIKAALLSSIAGYQQDHDEKVFIFDDAGTVLVHEDAMLVGKSVESLDRSMNVDDELVQKLSSNHGFYIEPSLTDEGAETSGYFTYVQHYAPWGWNVAASFSAQEVNHYIHQQQSILIENNRQQLFNFIVISLASTLIMIALSYIVSHVIAKRFKKFQQKISDDFGQLEQTKDQMQYMALHDPLTGLSNRTALQEQIAAGIAQSKRTDTSLAVVFLDLDDFKKVNDLYGHAVGDKLLECLSRKFEALLGEHDSVARFGGDEFIFCFPCVENQRHALDKTMAVKQVFADPLIIDGKLLTTDCSMGVSMYPSDSDDPSTLITNADVVLYRSKQHSKGGILFFDSDINQQIKDEYQIEQHLKHALRRNELSVVYQPQVCSELGITIGVEALVRWNAKELGFIPPDVFIPLAEEGGMIHDIGLFVFKQACEDILRLSNNGRGALNVSVNVSPKQLLHEGFIDSLMQITDEVGIETGRIMLEVTESIFIHDMQRVSPIVTALQAKGFGISLDDFGTGYSCLSHLNQFSIDELKIDKSFIANIIDNAQSNALVKTILAIGETYNIKVVAEGVETQEQYKMLSSYGCACVQGYYFARPLPYEELQGWLRNKEQA